MHIHTIWSWTWLTHTLKHTCISTTTNKVTAHAQWVSQVHISGATACSASIPTRAATSSCCRGCSSSGNAGPSDSLGLLSPPRFCPFSCSSSHPSFSPGWVDVTSAYLCRSRTLVSLKITFCILEEGKQTAVKKWKKNNDILQEILCIIFFVWL